MLGKVNFELTPVPSFFIFAKQGEPQSSPYAQGRHNEHSKTSNHSRCHNYLHRHRYSCATMITAADLLTIAILLLAAITNGIVAASDENPSNSEEENTNYFLACSSEDIPLALSTATALLLEDESLVHSTTRDGEHCLHLSALSGNVELVKLLLEKGADPNIRSTYESGLRMHPLSWSVYYGRADIIELLLKHGADVNADFDVKRGPETVEPLTALDVVEEILMQMDDDGDNKNRFIDTRNILVKYGGKRYVSEYGAGEEL